MLGQAHSDFEVVVSDNANDDSTATVLHNLRGDSRLRVTRLDTPVSVTANWNHALRHSRGEYVLVMGDDDILLPGYVTWLIDRIHASSPVDCITYNAYTYVAPGAIRGLHGSYFAEEHFHFGDGFASGRELSTPFRRDIVADMFRFRPRIPLNMQTTVFSRRTASRLSKVFEPPFPDHYALNALLLTVARWRYFAARPLVVGMSPKSFGHFVYSDDQSDGLAYLGSNTHFDGWLPGNELLNAMHVWLNILRMDFPDQLARIKVSRRNYVGRQIWSWYLQWRFGRLSSTGLLTRLRLISAADAMSLTSLLVDPHVISATAARIRVGRGARAQSLWHGLKPLPEVNSIAEFSDWVAARNAVQQNR
jgi:glycosyltransferase involved in cell wall biosynthesis